MSEYQPDASREIEVFCKYLTRRPTVDRVRELYCRAIRATDHVLSADDGALLSYVMKHPGRLSLVDAGLAIIQKESEVRRRLYIAFSILEASPEYADEFLSKPRDVWYLPVVLYVGVRAVCRTLAGTVLVKVVAR